MLAFCTSPSEIALVLKQSDANWLSEEMSFLSELYRSRAGPLLRSIQRAPLGGKLHDDSRSICSCLGIVGSHFF